MQKLLVFTDIHIVPEGADIIGLDPMARFRQGLDHALANHPDATRIIITGDLAHHGAPAEYARLKSALAGCALPVSLLIGNHDNRAAFRASFPGTPVDEAGFVQSYLDIGGYRLVFLDTVDETAAIEHSGALCATRLNWLARTLTSAGDRKAIIFMHHPPITTGFNAMDRIVLRNRAQFAEFLQDHANVCQLVAGHVHRTISGAAGNIPAAIFKSPCHQMPMALSHEDEHLSVDEPGAYGLLLLTGTGVIVHTEDFGLPPRNATSYASPKENAA
ncbi:phosphodiesterase [Roseovarius sp. CAU 1744]|uniref:phosphodiesterase n=1 Tax=Roseovarius sp. CAU 1744 TaxID=3140368 RepID=UPI00325AF5F0